MTCRTKPRRATDHDGNAGTAAKRICHRLFTIEEAAQFGGVAVHEIRYCANFGLLDRLSACGRSAMSSPGQPTISAA